MSDKKIDIIEYFEEVRQAYIDGDTEKSSSLVEQYGEQTVNLAEVENLVAHVFSVMAGFQVAMEQKDQFHFDIILNALQQSGAVSEGLVDGLRDLDNRMNTQLEGEFE